MPLTLLFYRYEILQKFAVSQTIRFLFYFIFQNLHKRGMNTAAAELEELYDLVIFCYLPRI